MNDQTLMNTTLEKALPGFLLLTDIASQIRIGRVINKGGNGILYEGVIVDPALRSRAKEDSVAVKKIECNLCSSQCFLGFSVSISSSFVDVADSQEPAAAIEAFHHEVTAMWSLSFHPNVLSLLAYDDATTSIVTPLFHVGFLSFSILDSFLFP